MKNVSKLLVLSFFALSAASAYAAPDAVITPEDQAVSNACAPDARTAGCSGEAFGKGLMKCLHKYKKRMPAYKLSPNCRFAIQQRHRNKKAAAIPASAPVTTPAPGHS